MSTELVNLLNRAAAALETPADLTDADRAALIQDLTVAAYYRSHGATDDPLAPEPDPFDNTQAESEGWAIFQCTGCDEPYRLERDDEKAIFTDDKYAWQFVVEKAQGGSAYHQAALEWLRVNSPVEFARINFPDGKERAQ